MRDRLIILIRRYVTAYETGAQHLLKGLADEIGQTIKDAALKWLNTARTSVHLTYRIHHSPPPRLEIVRLSAWHWDWPDKKLVIDGAGNVINDSIIFPHRAAKRLANYIQDLQNSVNGGNDNAT